MKDLATCEEDVISYALFPQVGKRFLEERNRGGRKEPGPVSDRAEKVPLNQLQKMAAARVEEKSSGPVPARGPAGQEPGGKGASKEERKMNLDDVRELIMLVNETGITEVKLESDGIKLAIKKGLDLKAGPGSSVPAEQALAIPSGQKETGSSMPEQTETKDQAALIPVISPMVGTFYRSPSPEAPPYVSVGEYIKKGQTLCIIEAMKLMNKIDSEVEGEIVEITVENGSPVEYGQTIFLIKQ